MEVVNLLEFLNKAEDLSTLDYASCKTGLINYLDFLLEDEQFIQKIDLGIIYIKQKFKNQFVIVDGLNRILSLSLLLHAICECYKKTSSKNENAIKTIRNKYLVNDSKTKLRLPEDDQIIYNKIIFGEKLSGKEKNSAIFQLLHNFWQQIKEQNLQASRLFKMLQKIYVVAAEVDNVPQRDLYYMLNKDKREINQLLLIENYMKNIGLKSDWNNFKAIFDNKSADINLFFNDFFITKFNNIKYEPTRLYEIFTNYFETMLQYQSEDVLVSKISKTAKLYNNLLNVNLPNEQIRKAIIQIKMHNGEDTFAYILNIYEDFVDKNISEATFLEILSTIDDYLKNRLKTPNNVSFNELIQYLNAFITCK